MLPTTGEAELICESKTGGLFYALIKNVLVAY
jgi:hypothetical protein